MSKTAIVTDSNSGITVDEAGRLGAFLVPMPCFIDGELFYEGRTLTQAGFYRRMTDGAEITTSQPTPGDVLMLWDEVLESYDELVYIPMSSALSGSCATATALAEDYDGHVHVVDSCNLSTGTGLLVVAAGKMIEQGMDASGIADALRKRTSKCHASFILDTLTFLHAGGRCSAVAALGANMLKLKPCIQVDNRDGSMGVGKKYRGSLDKILVKYVKDELAKYSDINTDLLFITHSGIPQEYIDLVRKTVEETMKFKEIHVTKASCTISCHCGPNTLGILFETR